MLAVCEALLPDYVIGAGDHVTLCVSGRDDVEPNPVQRFILNSQHHVDLLALHCIHTHKRDANQHQLLEVVSHFSLTDPECKCVC